ncbi:NAD(+)/NADH kinase [Pseudonocardia eucalypti]|uniref:NAD(+)/NADH kinase n=1 Tax=Pseudonocardia eucalypti TaxID=648755 RepID=A0ABP9PY52_9PSEU|nr:putative polyphosphate/ATP-dependent NAD kinase [Pseudonocardia eucalypti]
MGADDGDRNGAAVQSAVSAELPVVPGSALGIIANPMSGRDIRRLVARASVFPNAEKTNMVLRLISAAGAVGVERVYLSTDAMGVAAGVLRAAGKRGPRDGRWPELEFRELDDPRGNADDTRALARAMRARGVAVLVLLGGDGTVRAAAPECPDLPLLPLSTGTNNAFPEMWEATVAGTAAGLLATGRLAGEAVTYRAKALRVRCGDAYETALVDVCVSTVSHVGARALWEVGTLRELYCAFAEPHAIGLSSIAGLLSPVGRSEPGGVLVRLGDGGPGTRRVLAPIAPGVLASVGVREFGALREGQVVSSEVTRGTVAVDGERELEFGPATPVTVSLAGDGPTVLNVRAALAEAAARGLLTTGAHYQEVR